MSEEVKKILDRMIKSHELYKDIYDEPMRFVLNKKELNLLLDYITGLQQENKQLKERIDKVKEYITTEQLYTDYQWGKSQYTKILKDLLELLGDKE